MHAYAIEEIGKEIKVCISDAHTFGTDSFLLSHFAAPKRKDKAVDLGTGCGIIPLLWMREDAPASAVGVDIQADAIEQLECGISLSQVSHRLSALQADVKEIPSHLPAGSYSLVTCNPPYSTAGSGLESPTDSRLIARHETLCTLEDMAKAAAWLLQTGGRFCICQLPERLVDVMDTMRAHNLEPKRLRMVQQTEKDAPWLVLVEGKRNAKPGLIILPPLLLKEEGKPTQEISNIYHLYGRL